MAQVVEWRQVGEYAILTDCVRLRRMDLVLDDPKREAGFCYWSDCNTADAKFLVGISNPGRRIVGGGSGAIFSQLRFEPPTAKSPVSCTTIQPLLDLVQSVSPLLGAGSATDKKPKPCVCV